MTKVLLASLNAGGGHHALRDSFHSVLRRVDPLQRRFQPVVWDSSDRMVNWFYSVCVHHITPLQGLVVDMSDRDWVLDIVTRASPRLLREAQSVLTEQHYDAVVSTHFLLSMMLSKAKHTLGLDLPIIAAIPDYGVPTTAFRPPQPMLRADYTLVMAEDTYRHYVHTEGVSSRQVHWSGFITREPFTRVGTLIAEAESRAQAKAQLAAQVEKENAAIGGMDFSKPTVLFLGGSAWTAKTAPVLELLLAQPSLLRQLNVLVVCGKDAKFEQSLRERTERLPNVQVCGFVSPALLAQLMGLSDATVLGSLAPATMQELLEVGTAPLLLHHYIPGTELQHVKYIEAERIGLYERDPLRMVDLLTQAVGLTAPSARMKSTLDGFSERAHAIRTASKYRAAELPDFLGAVTGLPRKLRREIRPSEELAASSG